MPLPFLKYFYKKYFTDLMKCRKQTRKRNTNSYHDSGESGDGSETGDACGVAGVQHVRNHPTNAGCHETGVQSVPSRKNQGSAVQDTCEKRETG